MSDRAAGEDQRVISKACIEANVMLENTPDVARGYSDGGRYWTFSDLIFGESKTFKAGDMVDIQIMRTGKWDHQLYGKIEVSDKTLDRVVQNFQEGGRGIDLAVDENHEPDHKALAWFRDLYKKGKDALFAKLELTAKGAELLNQGAYRYFSPEIIMKKKDEETGKEVRDLLVGGAFTNRPFFKAMKPLMASEDAADLRQDQDSSSGSPVLFFNSNLMLTKLLQRLGDLGSKATISASDIAQVKYMFGEVAAEDRAAVAPALEDVYARFDESAGEGATPAAAITPAHPVEDVVVPTPLVTPTPEPTPPATPEPAAPEVTPPVETIQATEETVTIKASEFEAMKADRVKLTEQLRETRELKFSEQVKAITASEGNAGGSILPKDAAEIVEFGMSLSEEQANKMLNLFKRQSSLLSLTREFGSAAAEQAAGESALFAEAFREAKADGGTDEEAKAIAKEFCAMKGARV